MESSNQDFLYDDNNRPENPYTAAPKGPGAGENPYHANPAATPNPYGSWGQPDSNSVPNPWGQPGSNNVPNPWGQPEPARPANPYTNPTPVANPYTNPTPVANPYTTQVPPSYQAQPAQPHLEEFRQLPRQRRVVWDSSQLAQPFWTYVFLAIIAAFFCGQVATGYSLSGNGYGNGTLTDWGVFYKPAVLAGEWWRLITPIFLHFGLQHIFFNSLALLLFGIQIEPWLGGKRFVLFFMLTGIAGNLLTFYTTTGDGAIEAGASGAIFGILGASLSFFYRNRNTLGAYGQAALRNMLVNMGINLVFTFAVPGIGIQAHLGGLIAGLFLGYFVTPFQARPFASDKPDSNAIARSFVLNWWPVAVVAVVEAVAFYLALQSGGRASLPYSFQ